MSDIDSILAANRAALEDVVSAAEAAQAHWTTPRAAGKWSPQQIVEHVAMSFEEAANVIAGRPSKLPSLPAFLRPLGRMVFHRILKSGRFPKAKASRKMDPALSGLNGPASPAEARGRLEAGFAKFEAAVREKATAGTPVESSGFGRILLEDYARFTEMHTRHHARQIPVVL